MVPTLYLKRIKTDKYYYTFCSPEASHEIVKYLKTRPDLKMTDKLFDFTASTLLARFQEINDSMGWGFKGKYRFFRSHTLRKFHASNIGLSAEYIDELQGRSKNYVHSTYIKPNPEALKRIYKSAMKNVMIKEVEIPERINKETGEVIPATTITQFVLNPDYDPDVEYVSRSERSEWAAVGLVGQLIAVDDGTCEVGKYCKPSTGGIATIAEEKTKFLVMKRIDETHIKVFVGM